MNYSVIKMDKEVDRLKKEIERLKEQLEKPVEITWKVSEKGALSIYGLQRFPVTLYKEQWEKIFDKSDEIQNFMNDNSDKLTIKNA